ncbi:hypothetical protein BDZ94DRAFT_1326368 [Collybia nuda]|uniref:F-box domain-containing protein n=1 Tax=Collybia nuda TaxID=64659 RepID=A0A9P5XUL2_9AGAR|nr:hypothetical protein BDZ94DRAFT_1326368 [Collybia nuda]
MTPAAILQLGHSIGHTNAPVPDEVASAIREELPATETEFRRLDVQFALLLERRAHFLERRYGCISALSPHRQRRSPKQDELETHVPKVADRESQARAQLPEIEAELYRLQYDLPLILANRMRAAGRWDRYRAAIAPHKLLPEELIREVLLWAITDPVAIPAEAGLRNTRMSISQVCSAWRSILTTTPELWKDFAVSYTTQASELRATRLANHWLPRCGNFPLTFSIERKSEPHVTHADAGTLTISQRDYMVNSFITPNAPRLKELRAVFSLNSAEKLLAMPSASFDILEKLHLTIKYRPISSFIDFKSPLIFTRSPLLRDVTFWLRGHYNPLHLSLPWGQLTRLVLAGELPPRACLAVLNLCPNLKYCGFDHIVSGGHPLITENLVLPDLPLVLPNLESLNVHFDPDYFSQFFNLITVPNLSYLKLVRFYCWDRTFWTSPSVLEFLSSLSTSLKTFVFEDHYAEVVSSPYPPMDPLLECLLQAHSVTFPSDYSITEDTADAIAEGELLPQVEHLSFHSRTDRSVLLEMAEIRYALARNSQLNKDLTENLAAIRLIEGREFFAESFSIERSSGGRYVVVESRK